MKQHLWLAVLVLLIRLLIKKVTLNISRAPLKTLCLQHKISVNQVFVLDIKSASSLDTIQELILRVEFFIFFLSYVLFEPMS